MPIFACAFIPLGILAGTAMLCAVLSVWIEFSARGAARRATAGHSIEILSCPAAERQDTGPGVRIIDWAEALGSPAGPRAHAPDAEICYSEAALQSAGPPIGVT